MNFIQKLKCSLKTNYKTYYQTLSKEELEKRRKNLKKQYLAPIVMWLIALSIILFAEIKTEILFMLTGTIISTCAMLYDDYKRRSKFIEQLIRDR